MSTVLWCLARNIPLGHLEEWTRTKIEDHGGEIDAKTGFFSNKEVHNAARKIVNGLSQYHVAQRLAGEWSMLTENIPGLCGTIKKIAKENGHSGNVRKGILYLNKLVGGEILSRRQVVEERILKERGGKTFAESAKMKSGAVVGAERAFAPFVLPKEYNNWSSAKKNKFRQQLARDRREYRR